MASTQNTNPEYADKVNVASKNRSRKKLMKLKVTIANLLVFILVVGGFFWLVRNYFHIGDRDFTNAAQVEGFVNPINARVSGYIKEIRFIEHQTVHKGDTLIIMDDSELLTQLAQAEAAYMNALASRNVTLSSINTVANSVATTEANISGAKARLDNAKKNLQRYGNLLDSEAVTRFQYDQVETEYDMAKSSYEALVNQKKTANLSTQETKNRLALNDAEIKRTEAALEMARLNLSYTVIAAPYDGTMGRRLIQQGQLLQQPGMQVATIVSGEDKWVTANFLESQMPHITIGTKVRMKADALNGQEFEGVVTAISAATGSRYSNIPVDNSTGNFVKVQQRIPVRIEFSGNNDPEGLKRLRTGMNMDIFIKG
ncbi:HlyD family secretion protein [Proteiniphilum sp.]|nr:HlyD family secretion protein [Proteiniphilum sp.]MEA4916934.1 HlyD family secretion protein [Proteiniphilum sp.]